MLADILRVPVGPGTTHIERYGHGGTPFILLHGFGTCSFLWRYVAPLLANAGHTAYAVDLFGHGESDRTPDADLSIAAQAEYLDVAMTSLRVSRGIIVGNDLGGAVGLRLAATRPERVDKLVLINTPAYDELPARDITTMQRSTARFAFRVTRGVLGAAPLVQTVLEGSVANPESMPMRLVARYLAPFTGGDGVKHLLTLAAAVKGDDLEEIDFETIAAPTLIIRGRDDQWVSESIATRLHGEIPNSRFISVDDVARLIPEELPDYLCKLMLEFHAESPEFAERE